MNGPVELYDIVGHTASVDKETVCEIPEACSQNSTVPKKI